MTSKKIAIVLLNYNSEEDLFISTEQLAQQNNVDLVTIIVDNASSAETINNIQSWIQIFDEKAVAGSENDIFKLDLKVQTDAKTFVIYNDANYGYSAGNNIGVKVAEMLGSDAVLIVNPDMRFDDEHYISKLADLLFEQDDYVVASSRIIGLDGKDQSPMREVKFHEELLWPIQLIRKTKYLLPFEKNKIITVPKVLGSCLLLKMDFIKSIDYFDENTFLYSEEAILASQIKTRNKKIVFSGQLKAIHAHDASKKGNGSKRMLQMIKSRQYYLKNYSDYNNLQIILLKGSYAILSLLHYIKFKLA